MKHTMNTENAGPKQLESQSLRTINLLYLTPRRLFKNNYLLEQQWSSLESLVPCFLKYLYYGKIDIRLHEFDRLFSGLKNIQTPSEYDVLAKTASLWYYLTRITHQSIGPRVGRFAEEMIKYWIEKSGLFENVERDVTLSSILKNHFGLSKSYKNKLDFFIKGREEAIFIELRMSEHTGGRTGQESLLDKFNKILGLVASDELVEKSLKREIKAVKLYIAILFNENQELIRREDKNYNTGRLNSLISYIMEENQVWGAVYRLSDQFVFCDGKKLNKTDFESSLKNKHEVCLKHRAKNFKLHFKILLGDDFFRAVTGASLLELVSRHGDVIADDLWVMYTLVLNELKVANMFGKTNPRRIYEIAKKSEKMIPILKDFEDLYTKYGAGKDAGSNLLADYMSRLNSIIDKLAQVVPPVFAELKQPLTLLESNDMVMLYNYLRYVCASSLALYLSIDVNNDQFSKCRWEELSL